MAHVPTLLNSDQVAALVQFHPHTVRRFGHGQGDADFPQPVRKIGRRWMWNEDDVSAYLSGERHACVIVGDQHRTTGGSLRRDDAR